MIELTPVEFQKYSKKIYKYYNKYMKRRIFINKHFKCLWINSLFHNILDFVTPLKYRDLYANPYYQRIDAHILRQTYNIDKYTDENVTSYNRWLETLRKYQNQYVLDEENHRMLCIGIIETLEDYYYMLEDNDGKIHFETCVASLTLVV